MERLFSYNTECLPKVRMIGRINYREPWQHFARTIDEYILYYIVDGELYLEENEVKFHLQPGDCFLLEPNLHHTGYRKASCDYYYVHFRHPQLFPVDDGLICMKELMEKRKTSLVSYCLDEQDPTDPITYLPKRFNLPLLDYGSMLHGALLLYVRREEHYKRMVSAEFHRFLLRLSHEHLLIHAADGYHKPVKKSEIKVEELLHYINSNYSSKLTGKMIEEVFETNFDYLNRVFVNITGSTIFSFLNMIRINNSKQLIATTNLPFNEIAYLVGIDDRYYFTKLFRKHAGMTPSEYYKSVHENERNENYHTLPKQNTAL